MRVDMEIRPMTIGDYDHACSLWLSTPGMGLNSIDDTKEGIEKYLERNPGTCFAAEAEGHIAGVVLAGHDGRRGFIHHIAVAEKEQRHGIGSMLVETALEALKHQGIHRVALVVFKQNEKGNAFWEKQGFSIRSDIVYRNRALAEMKRVDI